MNKATRRCMVSLMVSVIATAVSAGILSVTLNEIIQNYGLASIQEGMMSSALSLGALSALAGSLLLKNRVPQKAWIGIGGILMSLMLILQGVALPFVVFLMSCFAVGMGMGVTDASQSAFLAHIAPGGTAKYMCILHGVFGLGNLLVPILLHAMLKALPWRQVHFFAGLFCLLIILQFVLILFVSVPKRPAEKDQGHTIEAQHRHMGYFFKSKPFQLLTMTLFFAAAAQSGIIVWTFRYVYVELGNAAAAAICLSLFWACTTISRFVAPILPVTRNKLLGFGSFATAVCWAAAIVINTPGAFVVMCCFAGLLSGMCMPMLIHAGTSLYPENTYTSSSVMMIVKTLAQSASPMVMSLVISLFGLRVSMYTTVVFFLIQVLIVREMHKRQV